MKPETVDLIDKSRQTLANARTIRAAGVPEVAAREAYMAAFHAAQAFLFERNGRTPKTHAGVHGTFGRIAKDDPRLGPELGRFLPDAYTYKEIADYAPKRTVTAADAVEAIEQAERFLATVEAALTG